MPELRDHFLLSGTGVEHSGVAVESPGIDTSEVQISVGLRLNLEDERTRGIVG